MAKNKGFRALIIFFIFYLTCHVKFPIMCLVRQGNGSRTEQKGTENVKEIIR